MLTGRRRLLGRAALSPQVIDVESGGLYKLGEKP
jgi:hypothetical protein